jgi:hypothetical protein
MARNRGRHVFVFVRSSGKFQLQGQRIADETAFKLPEGQILTAGYGIQWRAVFVAVDFTKIYLKRNGIWYTVFVTATGVSDQQIKITVN